MASEKLANRLIRDLPDMSTDELNITIDMVNDWATEASDADSRGAVHSLRSAISTELERRNPKGGGDGT